MKLVYGLFALHDAFAVLPADRAEVLADELDRVRACVTFGQARAVAPTLTLASVPAMLDDEDDADDDPFDWAQTGPCQDGDWPRMPTAYALEHLSRTVIADLEAEAGATIASTFLNGGFLDIPAGSEDALVTVLARHGHSVHRDDSLIERLGRCEA